MFNWKINACAILFRTGWSNKINNKNIYVINSFKRESRDKYIWKEFHKYIYLSFTLIIHIVDYARMFD